MTSIAFLVKNWFRFKSRIKVSLVNIKFDIGGGEFYLYLFLRFVYVKLKGRFIFQIAW